jgi:8-oxo-dGTP pyrophosphatase MutT (NUDIX family)
VSPLQPSAAWVSALRARADRPPHTPRVPLWAGDGCIGSVHPDLFTQAVLSPARGPSGIVQPERRHGVQGWRVHGPVTASLAELAFALRDAGVAHAWRDEQLAVSDDRGRIVGTVERAVVRPLGIVTRAVHLVGYSPQGAHWVQQRSLTKPNDPGMWDTLMGGMIPACDSLEQALERETWEEAGLTLAQVAGLRHGGRVTTRRPTGNGGWGYVVEHIDWYRCVLPDGITPINQDGEVSQFRLMNRDEVRAGLERDEFTVEAALILLAAGL